MPSEVVRDIAGHLREYGVYTVRGDRYAGEWPVAEFAERNVTYEHSELSKSEIYLNFLPYLNSGKVELLRHARLRIQLCNLERRSVRGARDVVDHPRGAHDDVANAAAGALLQVVGETTAWPAGL